MASCEARWIGDAEKAQALLSAIDADDPGMFTAEIANLDDGRVELIVGVTADNIATLQSTMDDLLACLAAAEGCPPARRRGVPCTRRGGQAARAWLP